MSTTELSMKMSLSPTNCRTMPEASVLTMTFGTPSGRTLIAAVPMVVPAEPPSARTPDNSPRANASRASRAAPSAALVTAWPRSAACRTAASVVPGELEDALARHVGRNGRVPERADVDERDSDAPGW